MNADVMVVNHSLLLADSAADNQILPGFDALIIDEAHNLEKNSYNYFAQKVNLPTLIYFLNGIYSGSAPERGLLVDLAESAHQLKSLDKIEPLRQMILEKTSDVKIAAEAFFRKIVATKFNPANGNQKSFGIKKRYKDFSREFPNLEIETNNLIYELGTLWNLLGNLSNKMDEIWGDYAEEYDELQVRLMNQKIMARHF